jgi:hypothetical protein
VGHSTVDACDLFERENLSVTTWIWEMAKSDWSFSSWALLCVICALSPSQHSVVATKNCWKFA